MSLLRQGFAGHVPRGIRVNNPGNLKELPGDKTQWVGERATDDDPIYEEFETMEHGVRALARTLLTYQNKHGCWTVGDFVLRFAPPEENDSAAYVRDLVKWLHVTVDEKLDLSKDLTLCALCSVIIRREQGRKEDGSDWVPAETIIRGVAMAHET